jgi:hypothetical protein
VRLGRAFALGPRPSNVAALAQRGGGRPRGGRGGPQPGAGRFNLEFFAQAENVLNRVNFTNYAGTITSRLFGQPTAAAQARRVQIGVNFGF